MKLVLKGKNRPLGMYIAGNPGYGKSSLIQNLVLQDVRKGRGVCVIDPTGDLVERLVNWMPRDRIEKEEIIYFDIENPVPIDFFSYSSKAERRVLTDQLLDIFHLENAPVSRPRLRKIIGTLFDANENPDMTEEDRCTFLDIQHFIDDPKRQQKILEYAPHRRSQWANFGKGKNADYTSITERMADFLEPGPLNLMLSCKRPTLNIADVIAKNQVLLVNLLDTPTDLFIGSLIAAKFKQAIFARRAVRETHRRPYYLYIDECNTILKYAVTDFDAILLRARKYKLCITLANQLPEKLPGEIRESLGTFGTVIVFNLENGLLLKKQIRPFEPDQLMELDEYQAVCRTDRNVSLITTPRFLGFSSASYASTIKSQTQRIYAAGSVQSGQIRPVDSPPSHTAPEPLPLRDDIKFDPTSAPKDVPPHRS